MLAPSRHILLLLVGLAVSAALEIANDFPSGVPTSTPTDRDLLRASFVSDGSSANVYFPDGILIEGSRVFHCFSLFSFIGIASASCQWASNSIVNIRFRGGIPAVKAGEKIVVFGGLYFGAPGSVYPVTLHAPNNPTVPVVVLPAYLAIVSCYTPTLDLTMSRGSGGRNWDSLTVTVTSEASTTAALQSFLTANVDSLKKMQPLKISPSFLEVGKSFLISLRLCNFLNSCGEGTMTIDVRSVPVPYFTLLGTTERSIMVGQQLFVELSPAVYLACQDESLISTQSGLHYDWDMKYNGITVSNLISVSKDPTKFKLPPNSLTSGQEYELSVSVWHDSAPLSVGTAVVMVHAEKGPLVAVVSGGLQHLLPLRRSAVLDASGSYDSDAGIFAGSANLLFKWECSQIAGGLMGSCPSLFLSSTTRSVLTINYTDSVFLPTAYRLVLNISDPSDLQRSVSLSIALTLIDEGDPFVALTKSVSSYKINSQDAIKLSATVMVHYDERLVWSVDDSVLAPTDLLTLPAAMELVPGTYTFSTVPLLRDLSFDVPYLLTLTCGITSASITLIVNGPPTNGELIVTPSRGIEAVDIFRFYTVYWSDSDSPIQYEFGILQASGDSTLIQPLSLRTAVSSVLPAGSSAQNYILPCFVRAYDSLGAFSTANNEITVKAGQWTESAAAFLDSLTKASSISILKHALSTTSAFLNNFNCSLAPDCGILHRDACSTTPSTCGPCLTGFVGEPGDHNTPCGTAENLTNAGLTSGCSSDLECSAWSYCEPAELVCKIKSKSCAAGCSGNGQCHFVNINDGRGDVQSCFLNDFTCKAVCMCNDGLSGLSCDVNTADLSQTKSMRSMVMLRLDETVTGDDVTFDSIVSFIGMLSASTRDPYSLTQESLKILLEVASTVVESFVALDIPEADMYGIIASMQSVLSAYSLEVGRRRVDISSHSALISKASTIIDSYGMAVAKKWLGFGRKESSSVLNNLKVSSKIFSDRDEVLMQLPLSSEENVMGIQPHSISMLSDSSEPKADFRIVSSELKGGYLSLDAHSSLLRLTVESVNVTRKFRFVIQHSRPMSYTVEASNMTFSTVCDAGDLSIHSYKCLRTGFTFSHNCNGSASILTSICPSIKYVSACLSVAEMDRVNEAESACQVESFSETNTSCICQMRPSIARRRLSNGILEDSGTLEIAAISSATSTEFTGTIYESRNIKSVSDFKQSVIVISMYTAMWGLGLTVSWYLSFSKNPDARSEQINKMLHGTKLNAIAQTTHSMDKIKKYLNAYIDEIFPTVFCDKPWYTRLLRELFKHHRFICIFVMGGGEKSRTVTTFHLLTIQTMLMFMLAVFYDIQFPADDGSCDELGINACEQEKSLFDQSKSKCLWREDDMDCVYIDPKLDWKMIIIISIVVAVFTAPLNLVVDFLFDDILSAPTADSLKAQNEANAMLQAGRRMSNAVRRASLSAATAIRRASNAASTFVSGMNPKRRKTTRLTMTQIMPAETISAQSLALACGPNLLNLLKEEGTHLQDLKPVPKYIPKDKKYHVLITEIEKQRQMLRPSEIHLYDISWGVYKNTDTPPGGCFLCFSDVSEIALQHELEFVEEEAEKRYQKLSQMSDSYVGVELLHLMILDLLGRDTPEAKIFMAKAGSEFRSAYVVTPIMKGIAWCLVMILNFCFIYFSILRGMQRGNKWQVGYAIACAAQLLIEVLLYETSECLWTNYVIPAAVSDDIQNIRFTLKTAVNSFCSVVKRDERYFLDAPSHLFVSAMLAKKYPEKIESMIINSYKSHIPGELSKKWSKKARKGVSQGMRNISVVTLGMVLLRYIGSLPWTVQRVAIHSLQPLVVAAGIIFVLFIVDNPIVAVIFAIPFVAKIIHFTIVKCTNRDGWCADRWNRKGRADRRIISNVSPVQTPTFGDIKNIAIIPKDDIAPSVHTTLRSNDRHRIIQNDSNDCRSDQSSELSDSTEGDILVKVPNIHAPEKALRDVIQGSARIDPIENIQNSYLSGHINSEHLPNYNVNQNQKKETKRHKSTVANSLANQLGEDASVERPLPVQSISEAGAKALAAAVHLSDQLRQLQVGSSDDNDSSSS